MSFKMFGFCKCREKCLTLYYFVCLFIEDMKCSQNIYQKPNALKVSCSLFLIHIHFKLSLTYLENSGRVNNV